MAHWYSKETYMATYEHMIHPIPGFKFYENSGRGPIQPPVVQIKVGRPQKQRRKDEMIKTPPKFQEEGTRRHVLSVLVKAITLELARTKSMKNQSFTR